MNQRIVETRTLRMHIREAGQGPLVVLCHGFPELGSTWRHQIVALAGAGYHAVAPDQRGYGRTESPERADAYTLLHLVGDLIALIDALGAERAILIGHDWGAPVVWHAARLRPDRVSAVVVMSVAPSRRSPIPTTAALERAFGKAYYQLLFQTPGVAEAELAGDLRQLFMRIFYYGSGDAPDDRRWKAAQGGFLATMGPPPDALPAWLEPSHLEELVETFQRTGFTGGLSWYRNLDRNWELLAAFEGAPLLPPALFITGDADPGYQTSRAAIEALGLVAVNLAGKIIIPGAGHWLGEERPREVNDAILGFLTTLRGAEVGKRTSR